jgi:hypothetical protein
MPEMHARKAAPDAFGRGVGLLRVKRPPTPQASRRLRGKGGGFRSAGFSRSLTWRPFGAPALPWRGVGAHGRGHAYSTVVRRSGWKSRVLPTSVGALGKIACVGRGEASDSSPNCEDQKQETGLRSARRAEPRTVNATGGVIARSAEAANPTFRRRDICRDGRPACEHVPKG